MWWLRPGEPVDLGDPPAGQGFAYQPATAAGELVQAVTFQLVTAVAVANRHVVVAVLDDRGAALAAVATPFVNTASHTTLYSFVAGQQQFGANDAAHIGGGLPGFALSRNFKLAVTVDAIAGADQISAVRLVVLPLCTDDANGGDG